MLVSSPASPYRCAGLPKPVLAGGIGQQHSCRLLTASSVSAQANLQPNQAVQVVNERLKRIGKINTEIAEWLQV